MEKVLQLKKVVNGGEQSIGEIASFTYSAKRMGSAPTISATFYSFEENAVDVNCFVEFRGERYFIDKTPSSSKSNTDARYKYDLEFVSERVTLDNIYLYNMSYSDSSASQETTFKFSGTIHDLAERIQLSIDYSYGVKNYYKIIVDDGIDADRTIWKVIDFKDTYVTNAIQESFNTFNLPYYYTFNGDVREFHIGNEPASVIKGTFKYGADDALLSISRTNANYKVINKITGVGSTENLPYYYPNESPTGEHDINYDEKLESVFIDYNTINKHVNIAKGCSLVYHIGYIKEDVESYFALRYVKFTELGNYGGQRVVAQKSYSFVNTVQLKMDSGEDFIDDVDLSIEFNNQANKTYKIRYDYAFSKIGADTSNAEILSYEVSSITSNNANITILSDNEALLSFGDWSGTCYVFFNFKIRVSNQKQKWMAANMSFSWMRLSEVSKEDFLSVEGEGLDIPISKSGIKVGAPFEGGKITISTAKNVIPFQKTLMPPIYRETYGNERFYLAKNEDVVVKGKTNDGTTYETSYNYGEYDNDGKLTERHAFNNPFILGKQVEHILNIEDIKPTIKGSTHTVGSKIYALDVFAEFGYDQEDNDEIGDDDEYKHPYFYGKLNPLGFNLFEHALEQGEMTISMTSGPCSACNFVIGVNDDKKNTVQVDASGNLLRDKDGNVRSGRKGLPKEAPQDIQNNTTNTHVWIALKKDKDTYGVIYPNATGGIKPISLDDETKDTTGLVKADTFVITNILLPNEYIYAAEERLENEIKKYLMENNDEKFNFSIKFSRIYLEEHKQDILPYLNENSRIYLEYFNKKVEQPLYVSSFTYKMSTDAPLPEIIVELKDSLAINQGVMKNIADQVKMSVMSSMASIDVAAQGARAFLLRGQDDSTVHKLAMQELEVKDIAKIGSDTTIGGSLGVDGKATFNDTIESKGDITVGEYTDVLGEVQGAKIGQDGSARFSTIKANSMEVFSIIYNQIRSTSAYTAFDDSATIVELTNLEDGTIEVGFESESNSSSHPFEVGDILFGYVNGINNFAYSKTGRCWLNVTNDTVEGKPWHIRATMFGNDDCPEGENIHPTTNMVVMHRGNNNEANKERQRTFYISSKDGCIVQLLGVTSPKLYTLMSNSNPDNYSNYGVVIGKLPTDLFNYIQDSYSLVKEEDPILYAKYLAVQNLLQIDYAGQPIKTERFRGEWSKATAISDNPYRSNDAKDVTYYDTVTFGGSKWQCLSDKNSEEPGEGSEWLTVVSKGADGKDAGNTYEILPSPSAITADDGVLSSSKITMEVGKTTPNGYEKITSNTDLAALGMSIWYSVDSGADTKLSSFSNGMNIGYGTKQVVFYLKKGEATITTKTVQVTYDGLTPKPNLLRYSNFDKYDYDSPTGDFYPVVGWCKYNEQGYIYDGNVVKDEYEGYNSFYMSVSSAGYKAENNHSITFKKGITYTLSCVVKSENITTSNNLAHGIIFAIPRDNVEEITWDVDDFGTNQPRNVFEIRFSPRPSWKEQYITFTVKDDCEAKLRIYSWATGGQIYISKLKLEESSIVTPYVRHIEDSNGSDGKNGEAGKDGEPFTFANLFKDPNFENVNEDDKILTDWGESSFSKLGSIVENAYEGYNAIGIMFSSYKIKQDCVLSPKAYTVSLMVKQESNYVAFFGVKSSVAVDIEPMSTTQNQLDSVATADYDKRYKIYTQKIDNYEYVTFKVTPSEEANVTFVFGNAMDGRSCYFCRPQLEEGDKATKFSLPMSSLAGPAGKDGPALYAAGVWDKNTEYVRDSLKVPYVYYQPSGASKGTYYVLKAETAKGVSQAPTTSNGNDYWEPITNLKYLFTEFLMSNQARFGSENGGVFYDNKLFSALYTDNTYYNGEINESKTPKLVINFRDGGLHAENAFIKGEIHADKGTFRGTLDAATGNIENVNAKNLTVESGEFSGTIKAEAGEIGGFEIKSDSIGAIATSNLGKEQASFSQKVIRFFKGVFGGTKQVSVGTNTIQEATDVPSLIRVDNTERNDTGINYGISVDVDNGGHNFALHAKHGSITSQGWVGSSGVSRITTPNESIYLENQMGAGNPFLWILKSERLNGTAFYLPHSSNLFKAMGVGVVPEVCSVKMTFICSDGSNAIRIVGKQANDDTLPKIIDKSGNQISFIELTAGNSATLLLDFIKTTNASSVTYNARAFIL